MVAPPVLDEVRDVWLLRGGTYAYCTVQITPYHICLVHDGRTDTLDIPLIAHAQREASAPAQGARGVRYLLVLYLCTHEQFLLGFSEESVLLRVMEKLKEAASIGTCRDSSRFRRADVRVFRAAGGAEQGRAAPKQACAKRATLGAAVRKAGAGHGCEPQRCECQAVDMG